MRPAVRLWATAIGRPREATLRAEVGAHHGQSRTPKRAPSLASQSRVYVLTSDDFNETGEAQTTPSGLQYIETQRGPAPPQGQARTVHYTGTLTNGNKFDSSRDRGQPFQFTIGVGQVIKGWDEGVATMKVGGKRKLMIPSALGYGARGWTDPTGATLIFAVDCWASVRGLSAAPKDPDLGGGRAVFVRRALAAHLRHRDRQQRSTHDRRRHHT